MKSTWMGPRALRAFWFIAAIATAATRHVTAQDLKPVMISTYPLTNFYIPNSVALSGSRAYVTYDTEGSVRRGVMVIFDISNPLSLQSLATNSVPVGALVTVRSNLAYVTTQTSLTTYDVTDPRAPRRTSSLSVQNNGSPLVIDGNYGFIPDGSSGGMSVLDMTTPTAPKRLSRINTVGQATSISLSGKFAYVAEIADNSSGQWEVIDISNPARPTLVASYPHNYPLWSILVADTVAYLGGGNFEPLALIDVQEPASVQLLGGYTAGPRGVLHGNTACFYGGGLAVLDLSNPAAPRRMGGLQADLWGLDWSGRYAYAGKASVGLSVIDLGGAASTQRRGGVSLPGRALDIAISGTRAFVANPDAGLQVLDLVDPLNPVLLGSVPVANPAELVFAHDNYAYLVDEQYLGMSMQSRTLHVIDVATPTSPREVGSYPSVSFMSPFHHGRFALAPDGHWGFFLMQVDYDSPLAIEIVDLSNASAPSLVRTYDLPDRGSGFVAPSGNLLAACVNGNSGGFLMLIDVRDPANPQRVGKLDFLGWAQSFSIAGTRAFISCASSSSESAFQIIDLSDPANPRLASSTAGIGSSWSNSAGTGNYLCGAASASGLDIVDISDQANPRIIGGNSAVLASGVAVLNGYAFVAAGSEGVQVFQLGLPPIAPAPDLKLIRSGASLTASWPAAFAKATLESTAELKPAAVWTPILDLPTLTGDRLLMPLISEAKGARFYRLRIP